MRLNTPRVAPLTDTDMGERERNTLKFVTHADGRIDNVFRTFGRHTEAARAFLTWGGYILGGSTLSARHREILILRTGWRCGAEYEWAQHKRIALKNALTADEIESLKQDNPPGGWPEHEQALVLTADELQANAFVSDSTWQVLAREFGEQELMDIVFTVGQYTLVSMALNTFGVQLDQGLTGF